MSSEHSKEEMVGFEEKKKKRAKWWWKLPSSEQDPISLEPLRRLPIEPFSLKEGDHTYRFDGRILAAYLVSSQRFVNPLTRTALSLEQCAWLDEHLAKNKVKTQSVARAWELCRDLGPNSEREALRAEANAVMQALFVPSASRSSTRHTLRAGLEEEEEAQDNVFFQEENLPSSTRQAPQPHAFPSLPEPETRVPDDSWTPALPRQRPRESRPNANEMRKREAQIKAEAEAKQFAQQSQRAARLADAFGLRRIIHRDEDRWPADLLRWARGDDGEAISTETLKRIERKLEEVVRYGKPVDLPPTRDARQRRKLENLAEFYCLSSDEFDAGINARGSKYLRVRISRQRFPNQARIPRPLLSASLHHVPPPPPQSRRQTKPHQRAKATRTQSTDTNQQNNRGSRENELNELPEPTKTVWALLDSDDSSDDEGTTENESITATPRKTSTFRCTADECPICLCHWGAEDTTLQDPNANAVVTLQCGHKYHSECLGNWHRMALEHQPPDEANLRFDHVLQTTTCPSCRQSHTLSAVQLPAGRWSSVNS